VLLRAGKTMRLLEQAGASDVKAEFFLALPTRNRFARRVEALLGGLPFGAQYLVCGRA
jgi:hypothetical protein